MPCNIGEEAGMGSIIGNEWSQIMAGHITPVGTGRTMMMERERPPPPDQQLKCPRCDSTNTKFCYYNNYSLAQPRHFCKACKRYWTRGGTLRSVPVGGGCRKNKRVKKSTASSTVDSYNLAPPPPPSLPIPSRRMEINPMLYPLPSTMGLISIPPCTGAYDLQPQLDGLGPGFLNDSRRDSYHQSVLESSLSQFQQLPTSQQSIMHDYHQMFGSSCVATTATANFFQGQPAKEVDEYGPLLPYDHHLLASSSSINGNPALQKQVKDEGDFSADWRLSCQNSVDTTVAATAVPCDSSFLYWSPTGWPDTTNGSSVAPLI